LLVEAGAAADEQRGGGVVDEHVLWCAVFVFSEVVAHHEGD
jgi:hypothetical protein